MLSLTLLLKIVLGLVFCYFMIFFLGWLDVKRKVEGYEKQGVKATPSAKDFIVGDFPMFAKWAALGKSGKKEIKHGFPYMMDEWFGNGGTFKPETTNGVIVTGMLGICQLWVFDPEIIQELFVSKNLQTDKNGVNDTVYKDLLGNSFLFGPGDKIWKAKRQACAHAFYKE